MANKFKAVRVRGRCTSWNAIYTKYGGIDPELFLKILSATVSSNRPDATVFLTPLEFHFLRDELDEYGMEFDRTEGQ